MKTKSPFRQYYDGDQDISLQGSFTNHLYQAWFKADSENKLRLLLGFPDFFTIEDYNFFCGYNSELHKFKEAIGTKEFNDFILTVLSGDDDAYSESLPETMEEVEYPYTGNLPNFIAAGYANSNIPWAETDRYIEQIKEYLTKNPIIPLP